MPLTTLFFRSLCSWASASWIFLEQALTHAPFACFLSFERRALHLMTLFRGGLQPGRPVLAIGGEGADLGVPHFFLTFFVLQEGDVEITGGGGGGGVWGAGMPPNRDDEGRVVGKFHPWGGGLNATPPFFQWLRDHEFVYPGDRWGSPWSPVVEGDLLLG
jgi:hypothetical protein